MHEYSIGRALIGRVEAEAAVRGATAVRSVSVRIGELSGVDVVLLATAYETLADGTVCRGSTLDLATVPARWACRECAGPIATGGPLRCPACGGPAALQQGDEILLERIEMDVEEREDRIDVRDARI